MDGLKQMYMETLKAGMESLQHDKDLADVDIVVNRRIFKCHKAILAAISPYFRAMFTGGMMESRQDRVKLQDIEEVPFEKFVQFVYTGKINMLEDDVVDILRLAALFQVDCLQHHCEGVLLEQLKADNCLELYRLSCMYNCLQLKKRSWPSILDSFSTVWQSEDFDNLPVEEVIAIIREDALVTLDEENVCDAVLKWINFNIEDRKQYSYRLLCHIRMPHLSPEYIVTNLYKAQYLMDDKQSRRLIDLAQHFHLLPARKLDYSSPRMKYRADDDLEEVLLVITENTDEVGSFYEGSCCLWTYSFQQKRWFTLAPIPLANAPGMNFAICSYDFDIYISGGTSNSKALLKFESERNEWIVSPGFLKKGRHQHSMVAVGNSLYCLGGTNQKVQKNSAVIGSVEEFHIPGQRWKLIGELNVPVHSAAAAVCGERILIFGGVGKDNMPLSCVQCFHSRLKDSSVISNLPNISRRLISTTIGEIIYITTNDHDGNSVFKLTPDFGFIDAGFEISTEPNILGISHQDGHFVIVSENPTTEGHLGDVIKLNIKTSKIEVLEMRGNSSPKLVHACHRSYIDKRFLYHSYFQ